MSLKSWITIIEVYYGGNIMLNGVNIMTLQEVFIGILRMIGGGFRNSLSNIKSYRCHALYFFKFYSLKGFDPLVFPLPFIIFPSTANCPPFSSVALGIK